jgi:outer membrane protein OmpA-like peptidoglycan-associated protein
MIKRVLTAVNIGSALLALGALAQARPPRAPLRTPDDQARQVAQNSVPIYRITVVARTIKAINYRHRSGSTKVEFRGTSLMPEARGNAEIASKQGTIDVDSEFKHIKPASTYGPEYLTFVLWAISPEGRPVNLGEVIPNRAGTAKLSVTSNLQSFGLIVSAEPYFAVTHPSDVVVMENFVTNDTNGTVEEVDAKYELLRRGQYALNVNASELTPLAVDSKTPLEIYEARNAIRIAKWTGAEQYAPDSLQKAELDLRNAEDMLSSHGNKKALITDAREAAQIAEDARAITVQKMEAEQQAAQRQAAADAKARAAAEAAAAAQSKAEAKESAQAKEEADAARAAALAQQQAAQAEAERARQQTQQAEQEKTAMRAKLLQQLNSILQTRDSARGLIMNMSDVLFDFGKYTLKPEAREKLAKVSGILLAYPGLSIEVDGHTDNVGSDTFNQTLSEERANAVREYLVQQGVSFDALSARGFGKTSPIASNDTPTGRAQNRRVELIVSGQAIGTDFNNNTLGQSAGRR